MFLVYQVTTLTNSIQYFFDSGVLLELAQFSKLALIDTLQSSLVKSKL